MGVCDTEEEIIEIDKLISDSKRIITNRVNNATIVDESIADEETLLKNAGEISFSKKHKKEVSKHTESYGVILESYSDNVRDTLELKRKLKQAFFILTIILLFIVTIVACGVLIGALVGVMLGVDSINLFAPVFSALVSIITAYHIIPQIIAEYLFNREEDKEMLEIIKNIQKYDSDIIEYSDNHPDKD